MTSTVIISDDNIEYAENVRAALADGRDARVIGGRANIIEFINKNETDLIVFGMDANDKSGFAFLDSLKYWLTAKNIAVIVLTDVNGSDDTARLFELDATDVIARRYDPVELAARAGSAIKFKQKLDLLNELAQKDTLTRLYNRSFFDQSIERLVANKSLYKNGVSLIFLDLNLFRQINNKYGHIYGDEALFSVANVCVKSTKPTDVVCRFGGDEFCVILPNTTVSQAFKVSERIRTNVPKKDFCFNGECVNITVSCGVSGTNETDSKSVKTLVDEADIAMYHAKNNNTERTVIYEECMGVETPD